MSNYSGFSSASVMELKRMVSKMAKMEAVMIANSLSTDASSTPVSLSQPVPSTSAQAGMRNSMNSENVNLTPSRKRHSSQQLGGAPKDLRVCGVNRFEVLTQANSYPDKSMRSGSVVSAPNTKSG
jgi:hypothetical protein